MSTLGADVERCNKQIADLEHKHEELTQRKRHALLKNDLGHVEKLNDELNHVNTQLLDLKTILLPELEKQIAEAKQREQEIARLSNISKKQEEMNRTLQELYNVSDALLNSYAVMSKSVAEYDNIAKKIRSLETEISHLGAPNVTPYLPDLTLPHTIRAFIRDEQTQWFFQKRQKQLAEWNRRNK